MPPTSQAAFRKGPHMLRQLRNVVQFMSRQHGAHQTSFAQFTCGSQYLPFRVVDQTALGLRKSRPYYEVLDLCSRVGNEDNGCIFDLADVTTGVAMPGDWKTRPSWHRLLLRGNRKRRCGT